MTIEREAIIVTDEMARAFWRVYAPDMDAFDENVEPVKRGLQAAIANLSRAAKPVASVVIVRDRDANVDVSYLQWIDSRGLPDGTKLYTYLPEPADAKDAARYRWLRQFLSIEDVGDAEMVYALVVDNEGLEDKASRARCWGCAEYHESAPGADDAIDAAMAQESGDGK